MSDFTLSRLQDVLEQANMMQPANRHPVAFAVSQSAYDALTGVFVRAPVGAKAQRQPGAIQVCGVIIEVKPGQLAPCWAFYDLRVFQAYMRPEVPASSLEGLVRLRTNEIVKFDSEGAEFR